MSDFFLDESEEKDPIKELCVVYVLYFDELKGHIPLLAYPKDYLRHDKEYMRPIEYHSIWFLDIEEDGLMGHIDLVYRGFKYFGKKFLTKSKRKKRRAGLNEETPETIVIIISLPQEIDVFGDRLIKTLTIKIKKNFEDKFYKIIESEIAQDFKEKTSKIEDIIKSGTKIKLNLRELIDKITQDFFSVELKKSLDDISSEKQKAVSFLSLRGIKSSIFKSIEGKSAITNFHSFESSEKYKKNKDNKT